jgi:hypothetical protein
MTVKSLNYKIILVLFCLLISRNFAQDKSKSYLDSLYNKLVSSNTINPKVPSPENYAEVEKCGMPLRAGIKYNYKLFTPAQQANITSIMDRPSTETSLVSPSGFFRIHYNASGTSAPAYNASLSAYDNAMLVAEAFDSAYSFEVNHLGFSAPPSDQGEGGDNLYDVYIVNISGFYGDTTPETGLGNNRETSYIRIDNDYVGNYTTHGVYAMRVTAAHEFHHAIQFGYIYRDNDVYFMELTSTSMEEFVFSDVNDYYGYLPHYFNNTSKVFTRFNTGDGYDLAIWNIFLADTLGIDIIRKQWELMPSMDAVDAIQQSLNDKNTSFFDMMNLFGIWCYYTGYRTQPGKYFPEAAKYPLIKPMSSVSFNSSSKSVSLPNCPPLSNTYVTFISTDANPDSLTVALSNSNYKAALNTPNNTYPIEYTLFNYAADGATKLNNEYYCSYAPTNQYWSTAEMFPDQLVKGGYFINGKVNYAFPSPFFYNKNSFIYIPVDAAAYENTYLNVYSSSMNLVYSAQVGIKKIYGQDLIQWNGKDNDGKELPSGVYIYALRTGDNNSSGKIVIIH